MNNHLARYATPSHITQRHAALRGLTVQDLLPFHGNVFMAVEMELGPNRVHSQASERGGIKGALNWARSGGNNSSFHDDNLEGRRQIVKLVKITLLGSE